MSARIPDSTFSLRDILDAKCAPVNDVRQSVLVQPQKNIRFNLNGLQPKPPEACVVRMGAGRLLAQPMALQLALARSKGSSEARIGSLNDDLNIRLEKATMRATTAETQLQAVQQKLKFERTTLETRIKAVTAQLGTAHAAESKLRDQLSRASKPASQFDTAVVAAIEVDKQLESLRKESCALKKALSQEKQRFSELQQRVDTSQAFEVALSAEKEKSQDLERKLAEESAETSQAFEVALSAEKEKFERKLAEASAETFEVALSAEKEKSQHLERKLAEASAETSQAFEVALSAEKEKSQHLERKLAEASAETSQAFEVALSAEKEKSQHLERKLAEASVRESDSIIDLRNKIAEKDSDAAAMHLRLQSARDDIARLRTRMAEAAVAEPREAEVQVAVVEPDSRWPDPVEMHSNYTRMRADLIEATKKVVEMASSGASEEHVRAVEAKRDDLYAAAVDLKSRYDTIFGAVDPTSVTDIASTERFAAQQSEGYVVEGDAPDAQKSFRFSATMQSASMSIIGHVPVSADCCECVGSAVVPPLIGVKAEDRPPTEGTPTDSMVKAVVYDLTNYLKNVQESSEALMKAKDELILKGHMVEEEKKEG